MKMRTVRALALAALTVTAGIPAGLAIGQTKLDPDLAHYKTVSGVSGNVSSVGSDTLNNLMTHWAESFQKFYPNAKVQIEGKGSSTAPPALISGTAQLGPMSRRDEGHGARRVREEVRLQADADSHVGGRARRVRQQGQPHHVPVVGSGRRDLSKSRRAGYKDDIRTWGQLGLTGDWANKPLSLYGRNSASGTYGFFKEHSLKNGDFKDEVKEQPGSASSSRASRWTATASATAGSGTPQACAGATGREGRRQVRRATRTTVLRQLSDGALLTLYGTRHRASRSASDPRVHQSSSSRAKVQEGVVKDGYFPDPGDDREGEQNKIQ